MTSIQKVLLIDDEPDIRRIAAMSLRAVGKWSVVAAGSGAEGIEAARLERPDVILLDVIMPSMDGPAALQRLKAEPATASIPVIFMSGAEGSEVARYAALGAAGWIAKPFDPMKLPAQVRDIVAARG